MERALLSCKAAGAAGEVAPAEQGLFQDEAKEVKSGQFSLQVSSSPNSELKSRDLLEDH